MMSSRLCRFFYGVLLALCAALPVYGGDLDGRDDPALSGAIQSWLDYDDAQALPVLADLAKNGSKAARILLARIATTERIASEYVLGLTPLEFNRIFRSPPESGKLPRSWLLAEAEAGNRLAQVLLAAASPHVALSIIRELGDLGEYQAATHPMRIAALYGSDEERQRLLDSGTLEEMHPYVLSHWTNTVGITDGFAALRHLLTQSGVPADAVDATDADARDAAQYLAVGFPYAQLTQDNAYYPPISQWIMGTGSTRPIASACMTHCPDARFSCGITLMGLLGGYYEVIRHDSPLQSLIPQDVFLASERASIGTLRRAALRRAEYGGKLMPSSELERRAACLVPVFSEIRQSIADID